MENFQLTESEQMIWDLAHKFAREEIAPIASEFDQRQELPMDVVHKAQELGLMNVTISEEYGGLGLSNLEFIFVTENLCWGCVSVGGSMALNTMIADCLNVGANDTQKKKYYKRLLDGEFGAYGLTEPNAGSDVAAIQTTAIKQGDHYVLNGSKTWISNAVEASFFIIFAKTDSDAGNKGMSVFLVEKDTPGFTLGKKLSKMGQRAGSACELFFEDMKIPEESRLGAEGDGFMIAMKVFDRSRPMVAAYGLGVTQRCLDESIQYSKERKTMGKPIFKHQAISQKIADMGLRLEAAKLLTYKACTLLDNGESNTLNASYAKTFAGDTAVWASSEAVQIFGGMGYSPEYPVEKLYRDAKVLQIYEGTHEIQRIIMARELINED